MQLVVRDNQGVEEWCVTLKGSFGFETARAFLSEMKKRPASGRARIVFDLAAVDHLESSGLGAMLLVVERMNSQARPTIRCGNENVWAVLHIAHMERLFDIEAVGALRNRPTTSVMSSPYNAQTSTASKAAAKTST